MSYHKDIGPAALFVYNLSHHTSRRPYLRRNVREVLGALIMGSTISSLKSTIGARAREEVMASDDEEDERQRPAKRRKIDQSDERRSTSLAADDEPFECRRPFGQVMNESRRTSGRASAKPDIINPINFYGGPQSAAQKLAQPARLEKMSKKRISRCLPRTTVDFAESMRIDLLQINAEHDETVPDEAQWGQVADIKCRCAVAIFYAKNDEKPGDVKPSDFLEICRIPQACKYRISISKDGEITREILAEPFIFTKDHFYVHRRTRKPNGQWDTHSDGFGFADKYNIKVFLESMGSSVTWPAMDLTSASDINPIGDLIAEGSIVHEDVSLYARTNPWLSAERHSKTDLHAVHKGTSQKISYSLEMMIRWALPNQLNELNIESTKQVSAPKLRSEPAPEPPESPRKAEIIMPPESPGDSRAARRRSNVPTYNLKALSSIAQGKSPRAPRAQRPRSEQHIPENGEITVTYCFGKAEAAETGIKRETTVVGLKCPFCLSRNRSLDQLRLHLNTDHSAYKFHLRRPNPPRVTFFIELARSSRPGLLNMPERSRIIQLGQPMTLFDLEKHLNGDESWIKARRGLLHNGWPEHLTEKRMVDSSHSSSPRGSRYSSPNTSNDTDDFMDVDKYEPRRPAKERKVHYVPKINRPLFDPVTKRQLKAGEPLPNSDDETDESWLHQQRRDGINDFTDIPPEEKEYINKFNPYIIDEHLTSMRHLPDAMVRFVEANKSWIAEKVSRRQEFMKQMENFLLKGYVDEKGVLDRCFRILIAEEKAMKSRKQNSGNADDDNEDVDMNRVEEEPAPLKRGLHTCKCGEITMPPNRVVCRGLTCPARFFCIPCAKGFGRPIAGEWKCDICTS
ncbi:hypothetical protein ONS95_010659 [Cadophora gregata]|uniref:uncharacterized protein n=1 Tax=Cadophora gregata TaxID=51156 RepID=UPI0026DC5C1E|nr:uncharacterized protein ONS95_010659 [Cadophora gregata]KAK0122423.1 hypothetical protein ONS95_010659 [Cadophora gregata]KAK0127900.1 hypothetical protein ONS96_007400 [Cadophora gregata f. sp. sojae]